MQRAWLYVCLHSHQCNRDSHGIGLFGVIVSSCIFQAIFANPIFFTFAQSCLFQLRWSQRSMFFLSPLFHPQFESAISGPSEFQPNLLSQFLEFQNFPDLSLSWLKSHIKSLRDSLLLFFFFSTFFNFCNNSADKTLFLTLCIGAIFPYHRPQEF